MGEIEIGEYVRTEEGYIGILIEYIPNALNYLKIDVGKEIRRDNGMSDNYIYTRYGFQLKHSKQIIDLVEVGDYVNEREVKHIAMFEGFPDYPKLIFVDETHLIPDDTCENDEIKTILTKEQFEQNSYKVGGEDGN